MISVIEDYIKRYGIAGFCEKIFFMCLSKVGIDISIWNMISIDPLKIPTLKASNIEFRSLTIEDIMKQKDPNPEWFNEEKVDSIAQALQIEGTYIYGTYEGTLLICYGVLSIKMMGAENILLKANDAYLWDDYVHPLYRGKKLHQYLNKYRIEQSIVYNKSRCLSIIGNFNRASMVGYSRLGFTRLNRFIKYKFFTSIEKSTLSY